MMPSKWERHVRKWEDCQKCELAERRKNVVLFRGKVPNDVLFIGEAPGVVEDKFGKPFKGPAGLLLDDMISKAIEEVPAAKSYKMGFTNMISCIPLDEEGHKAKQPMPSHVRECWEIFRGFCSFSRFTCSIK